MSTRFLRIFNFGLGFLAADVSSASTTITLQEGDLDAFPAPGPILDRYRVIIDREIMEVTGRDEALNTLTILRGLEGTIATTHLNLALVTLRLTAAGLLLMQDAINTLEASLGTIQIRVNSGLDVGDRPRINLIDGTNIDISGVDSAPDNEVTLTFDVNLDSYAVADLPAGSMGDMAFATDGRKLLMAAHGEIYAEDTNATVAIAAALEANKVQVTVFDTNGISDLMTPDHANDHITVLRAGDYQCVVTLTTDSVGGTAAKFAFGVFKNDGTTHFDNLHVHRDLPSGAGGQAASLAMTGIITLAVDDTIEVWCWNEDNAQDIVVDDITLTLAQVDDIGEPAGAGTGVMVYHDGTAWRRVGDGMTVVA